MNIGFKSERKPQMLVIKVRTKAPAKIMLRVRDVKKPSTLYTDRYATVKGEQTFMVKMPQSPDTGIIEIFNARNGNLAAGRDKTFEIVQVDAQPLKSNLNVWSTKNRQLKSFIKFAQDFSDRAAILSASLPDGASVYHSDDGKFTIKYFDVITDRKSGRPLKTPSRIRRDNGTIEVAKKYFLGYTIPMRMAILLHEYCHFYFNEDPRSELQADRNSLLIYLGLNYPTIEAYQAWLEVFKGTDTLQNRERYEQLKQIIDQFGKSNRRLI